MTTREMAEIMLAYDRGEQIERREKYGKVWYNEYHPFWDWNNFEYRVKSKPAFRPYKNEKEFFAAHKEHGMWLESKSVDCYFIPVRVMGSGIEISAVNTDGLFYSHLINFTELLDLYRWQDGTPCGKEE